MKKIFTIITVFLLITACGGGGYGSPDPEQNPYGSGSAPTGSFSGQVDPVQTTNN